MTGVQTCALPILKKPRKENLQGLKDLFNFCFFVVEGNIQAKYEGAIPAADLDKLFKG